MKQGSGVLLGEAEDRATTPNLDIVGMGAQAQNLQLRVRPSA
jgi:hypothetical protein